MAQRNKRQKGTADCSDNSGDETGTQIDQLEIKDQLKRIFDKLLSLEQSNKENINKLTDDVVVLKDKVDHLATENEKLKSEIQFLKQVNTSTSVVFHGLPKPKDANDQVIIETVAAKLGVQVTEADVVESFRLKSKENNPPPIVVKFVRRALKQELLRTSKETPITSGEVGFINTNHKIAIREFITRETNDLLKHARKLRDKGYKFVWQSGGRVLTKREENSATIVIKDREHVNTLLKLRNTTKKN